MRFTHGCVQDPKRSLSNTQLASPDWLPVTVQIARWPAVDAPVYLEFRGLTDWAIPIDFTLDNVQLVTVWALASSQPYWPPSRRWRSPGPRWSWTIRRNWTGWL